MAEKNECPWNANTFEAARRKIKVMEWLKKNGYPGAQILSQAAENADLETMDWLKGLTVFARET